MISSLDLLRSKFLKKTLQITLLDRLFHSRSTRISFLGFTALLFYFFASSYFPLLILVIGPIIWGIPHLISSLRYNTLLGTKIQSGKQIFYLQGLLWLFVFLYRIAVDIFQIELLFYDQTFLIESTALIISFLAQLLYLKRLNLRSILYFLTFSLLIVITHEYPIEVALVLLIGHNYLPLIAWFQACQNKADTDTFFKFTLFYLLLSAFILLGFQENIYNFLGSTLSPQKEIPFFNWNFMNIVEPFGATPEQASFWFRIVVLYSFSQSIHYFLWLKAIPENYQLQQFPPSFRWTFQKLQTDFGGTSLVILLLILVAGLGYWAFFEYHSARTIYFAIASYHGFMELSCLPFLKSNRRTL